MAQRIVGVDIGDTAIRAVEVQNPTKARPTVVRFHEIALPDGAVRSGEVIEQNTVATALRQLWSEGKFRTRDVVLGIGNQKVVARDLTVAHAPISRIREALPFQVQELIPVPVEDALLDFYPIAAVEGEHGPAVSGLLVAAVKAAVEANVSAVRQAGLSPVDVDLIPFALLRALNHAGEGTNAFIDIGASATNVVLATGGVPQFVRIIPTGGGDLTRALASRLSIEFDEAEEVKRSVGLAPQDPEQQHIAQIVYEVSVELLTSLRNTLHFFANTRSNGTIQKVVLNGGGAYLPGFSALLQEAVRIPVEFGDPFSRVSVGKGVTAGAGNQKGAMTVALGLAIGGAA